MQPREKRPAMILKDILAFGIVVYVVLDCFDGVTRLASWCGATSRGH
ncbi:hypothetical protein [Rhizobium mongolense]